MQKEWEAKLTVTFQTSYKMSYLDVLYIYSKSVQLPAAEPHDFSFTSIVHFLCAFVLKSQTNLLGKQDHWWNVCQPPPQLFQIAYLCSLCLPLCLYQSMLQHSYLTFCLLIKKHVTSLAPLWTVNKEQAQEEIIQTMRKGTMKKLGTSVYHLLKCCTNQYICNKKSKDYVKVIALLLCNKIYQCLMFTTFI